jgi:hypothetical protein
VGRAGGLAVDSRGAGARTTNGSTALRSIEALQTSGGKRVGALLYLGIFRWYQERPGTVRDAVDASIANLTR